MNTELPPRRMRRDSLGAREGPVVIQILKLSLELFLPETKCVATKTLLDTFPTDAVTKNPVTKNQLDFF
jgi:hypothetical protein